MVSREYIEQAWEYGLTGAEGFTRFFQACTAAGFCVPAEGSPGQYELNPENWPAAREAIGEGLDKWAKAMMTGAAVRQEKEASNVICLEHRKKLHNGEHVNDGSTRCSHRRYAKKTQEAPAQASRPQAAS
jgi:hypothetical protein